MATRPQTDAFYRPTRFTHQEQVHSLTLLNEAAQSINSILDLDVLLDKIVNEVAVKFGCIETAVWLADDAEQEMVLAGVQGCTLYKKGIRLKIGREGMIGQAAASGRVVYAPDVREDPYYIACEPGIMAELDIPLVCHGKVIGVFSAVHCEVNGFSESQIHLLQKLCEHIGVAVHNARLFSKDRAERDEARQIQQALFPKTSPYAPGYWIDGHCVPAGAVGGDWYDYIHLPDGNIGVVLADVSGKGMPAAMLMSATRGVLRSLSATNPSPSQVLAALNRYLVSDLPPEKFVTMVYAVLDPARHTLTYANAGHPWPVLLTDQPTLLQTASGLPLGLIECEYDEVTVELSVGSGFLVYSDGVTEACRSDGDEFGVERLLAQAESREDCAQGLVERVQAFADHRGLTDDATVVVLRRES